MSASQQVDVFGGTDTQELGEEREEGVVFSVSLKRVRYRRSVSTGSTDEGHLQWNSQKVRTLRAGTVEKIVERLVPYGEEVDVSYRACFLCTFRTFTTVQDVLRILIERYSSMTPSDADSSKTVKIKLSNQNEIVIFIRQWMETCPTDFDLTSSHTHLTLLHPLTAQSAELAKVVEALKSSTGATEEQDGTMPTFPNGSAKANGDSSSVQSQDLDSPSRFSLFSLSPDRFAHHLTAHDAELFLDVIDHQCLEYIRRPKDIDNAPTVRSCIEHFNRVSLVVIATILGGVAAEGRGSVISHWIDIAQCCRAVKNFSSLKAIVSGLQSTTVHRLKKSWSVVSSEKRLLFQELSDLFAVDDNHRISRDLLTREGTAKYAEISPKRNKRHRNGSSNGSIQGVVPYLGTFLTDLTMVNSAYGDLTQDGLVNFDKCRKQFELLVQLTLYQKSAANYCFSRHHNLDHWLANMNTLAPKDSYQLSKQLEPDDLPSSLYVPESSLSSLSPARIRRALRQVFNSKGNLVGDLSPSPPVHRLRKHRLTPSLSEKDLLCAIDGRDMSKDGERTHIANTIVLDDKQAVRAVSLSPEMSRNRKLSAPEIPLGHIVRVTMAEHDHCNYKSLLLNEGDKTLTVITRAIKKLGIQGPPSHYSLVQILPGDKKLTIPQSGNVYYALSKSQEEVATLLLVKQQSTTL